MKGLKTGVVLLIPIIIFILFFSRPLLTSEGQPDRALTVEEMQEKILLLEAKVQMLEAKISRLEQEEPQQKSHRGKKSELLGSTIIPELPSNAPATLTETAAGSEIE